MKKTNRKKLKIKQNKTNIISVIIGRLALYAASYALTIIAGLKILNFIINNCITTLN